MDKALDTGRPLCTTHLALVATGFDGLDVSLDGGQSWAHHSDSSQYVARFFTRRPYLVVGRCEADDAHELAIAVTWMPTKTSFTDSPKT